MPISLMRDQLRSLREATFGPLRFFSSSRLRPAFPFPTLCPLYLPFAWATPFQGQQRSFISSFENVVVALMARKEIRTLSVRAETSEQESDALPARGRLPSQGCARQWGRLGRPGGTSVEKWRG